MFSVVEMILVIVLKGMIWGLCSTPDSDAEDGLVKRDGAEPLQCSGSGMDGDNGSIVDNDACVVL